MKSEALLPIQKKRANSENSEERNGRKREDKKRGEEDSSESRAATQRNSLVTVAKNLSQPQEAASVEAELQFGKT